MKIEGFNLMLQDFCDYCEHFRPKLSRLIVRHLEMHRSILIISDA